MMKLTRKAVALAGAAAMMASCNHMKQIKHMPYPETQRTDVVDDYFGTKVADPYRWLEDDNSEATAAWVKAQNAVTQDYLSQIPFRDAIRGRLPSCGITLRRASRPNTAMRGTISTTTGCRTSRCSTVRRPPVRKARCSSIPIRSRRRDGGAFVGGFFQGREILRLRGGRIRLGLGRDSCDEHRRPHVHDR